MRHIPARPEQTSLPNSLTSLVNDALRAAAISSTPNDAIDVLGAALIAAAMLVRMEARHA